MNLVVDIGNSRTKFSLFSKGKVIITVPVSELLPEHIILLKNEHPLLNKAILSSVREYPDSLKETLQNNFDTFLELNHQTLLPVENMYLSKETLGNDRIAAAVGANNLYRNTNLLVIDAGTALTYDFVNDKNQYLGGNIAPGLEMRFKSLHYFTGKLPLVEAQSQNKLYGSTTEEAILAGVQNGFIYEVDKTIEMFNVFYGNLKVIITGGNANFFDKELKKPFFVHSNLVAQGLNSILEYNENK
ncbi:MAG: type III pantothenate kinase [Bacteroidales bacterium]|nr:type III pantothenate kinase [Bacteroidales bacterium]